MLFRSRGLSCCKITVGQHCKTVEQLRCTRRNDTKNRWNLLDYGDVIVHVLHKEERETYALERFWSHAYCMDEAEWKEKSKDYTDYSGNN